MPIAWCRGGDDASRGASVLGWGIAFGHVTVALLLGALAFVWLGPADLAGDRSVDAVTVQPRDRAESLLACRG